MDSLCNSYIAIDVETTGLKVKEDRIIEIAAVKVIDGVETKHFNTLVDPHMRLSDHTKAITGISEDELKLKPDIEEIMPDLLEFMEDLPLLGHRVLFDYSFIKKRQSTLIWI